VEFKTNEKIESTPDNTSTLQDIQELVAGLNSNLLKLKKEKENYQVRIKECKGLCFKIRELMDATTARIIPKQ